MEKKSEVFNFFQEYKALVENNFEKKIAKLRTDNGGEYTSEEFTKFCKVNGIKIEQTAPYNPQQNGVSERYNRTLMERARAMIKDLDLPKYLWGEAIRTAAFIINRSPTRAVQEKGTSTPAELWYSQKPNITKLKVFGCTAYAYIPENNRTKLDDKCKKLVMIGYTTNAYRLYDPQNKKVIVSRNVTFDESTTYWTTGKQIEYTDIKCAETEEETIEKQENNEANQEQNMEYGIWTTKLTVHLH